MSYLKDLVRADKERQKAQAKAAPKAEYGVFVWTGKGVYPRAEAVKIYKYESGAKRHCDKLNEVTPRFVVRTLYPEGA